MNNVSFFDGANRFVIDKPIRLIELFAGIGAQAKAIGMSDAQLYKQAGNSIVVNVLEAIMKKLIKNT